MKQSPAFITLCSAYKMTKIIERLKGELCDHMFMHNGKKYRDELRYTPYILDPKKSTAEISLGRHSEEKEVRLMGMSCSRTSRLVLAAWDKHQG